MNKCEICNIDIPWGITCGNCWEVSRRLPEFIRSDNGVEFVMNEIQKLIDKDRKNFSIVMKLYMRNT